MFQAQPRLHTLQIFVRSHNPFGWTDSNDFNAVRFYFAGSFISMVIGLLE
jgi:hypothetical protein